MSDGDHRRHNHILSNHKHPTSSSTNDRRPNPQEDVSWLDFLRTAGGTVPADHSAPFSLPSNRSDSADRKRRHTGSSEPERRDYPYPTHCGRSTDRRLAGSIVQGLGNSRETTIDLTSPPRRLPPSSLSHIMQTSNDERPSTPTRREESDAALPTWQPDAEVTECPVCQAEFSFWFRKHHCRKCGRVVCANCSPHRITIPKQYIVQPPNPYEDEANPSSPGGFRGDPALGGGDTVRVCNPCVPDPWTPHTTAPNTDTTGGPARSPIRPPPRFAPVPNDPRLLASRNPINRESLLTQAIERERDRPEQYRNNSSPHTSGRSRAHTYQNPLIPPFHPSNLPNNLNPLNPHNRDFTDFLEREREPLAPEPHPRSRYGYGHRYTHSVTDDPRSPQRPRVPAPPPARPAPTAPVVPSRRREVKEEDECPVCGVELPPGEALREIHIRQCIETRFSSTPTQSPRRAPPAEETPVPPGAGSHIHAMAAASSRARATFAEEQARASPAEGSRPRATSYKSRGMALYRATEKDCMTEDGEPQECIICFEDFETGDEMGRMECLCKFHRHCIRQWWETKGQGSCPTHQLHN